ncbi:disease resistance protein RLM3-like [Vigna unguiculata]|uniref:disease resistance protein RLM3-like n=1 Tax=Vigna unguiculata TaxID=3917 RepID=UPI001016B552|nr:disease resistance protein RLM3-like [Vigna unguiculata]
MALQNAGIIVFKDDESLPRGKQISPSLRLAIEESRISVVVFLKIYAESWWCLKELEKIMECHRTIGQMVIPVFYDVDPSEVRHHTPFEQDFDKGRRKGAGLEATLEDETWFERVNKPLEHWKEALSVVVQSS